MDDKFNQFYTNLDKSVLNRLNEQAKVAQNIKIFRIVLGILTVISFLSIQASMSIHNINGLPFLLFIISLVGFFGFFIFSQNKLKVFRNNFKQQIISKIITFIDPELLYQYNYGFPENDYNNSGISESYTNYHSDDLITGNLSGVPIRAAEIFTEKVVRSGKHTHRVTLFKGLFMEARFNKRFSGATTIFPDKGFSIGNFIEKTGKKIFSDTTEAITLESSEFNNMFNVYSTNQVEARYILSTSFMEKLPEFKRNLDLEVLFSFKYSNIYIKIDFNNELFEPDTSENCVSKEKIYIFYSFLKFMESIITEFKLNQDIWDSEVV
ncbi:MAG: hypothetical protein A2Y17_08705 [Clostridiales bacterium GWF2_38_85]|nr:MAG: hypothetical protein A2Y17_08705 [Clostridiales bacterium GWF2_38_85]